MDNSFFKSPFTEKSYNHLIQTFHFYGQSSADSQWNCSAKWKSKIATPPEG